MRFRYRYTDSFYKKMLNSEFLEVSIFLYLPVSSRRSRQKSTPRKTIFNKLPTGATRQEVLS